MPGEEFIFGADAQGVLDELDKIVDEARQTGSGLARGIGDGVESARRKTEKETRKIKGAYREAFEGSGKILKAFEGQVGGAFSVVEDFSDGLVEMSGALGAGGTALAGTGLVAAALAFTLAGVSSAAVSLAKDAGEAAKKVEGIVPKEAIASAKSAGASVEALSTEVDRLKVIAVDTLPPIQGLVDVLVGGVRRLSDTLEAVDAVAEAFESAGDAVDAFVQPIEELSVLEARTEQARELADALHSISSGARTAASFLVGLGAVPTFLAMREEGEALHGEIGALPPELLKVKGKVHEVADEVTSLVDWWEESTKAAEDHRKAIQDTLKDADKLADIIRDMNDQQLSEGQQVLTHYQDLRELVVGLSDDYGLQAEALEAINAAQWAEVVDNAEGALGEMEDALSGMAGQVDGELSGLLESYMEDVQEAGDNFRDLVWDSTQTIADSIDTLLGRVQDGILDSARKQVEATEEVARRNADLAREQAERDREAALRHGDVTQGQRESIEARYQDDLDRIDSTLEAELAAAQEIGKDAEARAKKAFGIQQALQSSLAIIDAARSAITLIPSFAILGPAAPAAAAGVAAAALAAQLAVIHSQPPPEFPTGLSSDHYMAGLQRGELVASRRAAADPVVRDAIDQGNRGVRQSPAALEGGERRVRVELDRRLGRLRVVEDRRVGKRPPRRR